MQQQPVDASAPLDSGSASPGLTGDGATVIIGTVYDAGPYIGGTIGAGGPGGSVAAGSTMAGAGGMTAGGGFPGGFTAGGGFFPGFTAGGGFPGGFTAGGGFPGGFTAGGGAGGAPVEPLDPSVRQPAANKLPKVNGACPDLSRDGSISVAGAKVQVWVGTKPGPVYVYFHGTGTSPGEVNQALPGATAGVKTNGGIVASWDTSNGKGSNTGTIWYTGDLEGMDQIVACGIEKGIVDTGRIHVSGYSAGGLETGAALFSRSNYVASVIIYSGGKPFGAGGLQDPSNVPAVLGAHGAKGSDALGLDFHDGTIAVENEVKRLGGFAIDCDDGGSHVSFSRLGLGGKALQFFKDHPYNTKPSPYAGGLPAGFPSNCKVVQ